MSFSNKKTLLWILFYLTTCCVWIDGSRITFTASPAVLKANITHAASMRCDLHGTDVTRGAVTNTSRDIQHVTSIWVTNHDGQDVAHASIFDAPAALTDIGNLQVKGEITGTSSEGYLELTWQTPALMTTGQYVCEVSTIDQHRHETKFRASLELSRVEPSLNDVVVLLQQQQHRHDVEIASLKQEVTNQNQVIGALKQDNNNQSQMIDHLNQQDVNKTNIITNLKQDLANQNLAISQLKKCTSPKVAFMAVMTTSASLSSHPNATWDKVITDTDGSFNKATGQFTCRQPGLYFFTVTGLVQGSNLAALHLYLNSDKVTTASAWGGNYPSGSAHAVLQLKMNDVVYVKSVYSNALYNHPSDLYQSNSFRGHILRSDDCQA